MDKKTAGTAVERHSVLHHAATDYAAQRYLDWERLSYDIEPTTSEDWRRRYWRLWFRGHWVEHIRGTHYWIEMGDENFGMFAGDEHHDPLLVERVADRLIVGWENLGIILWASDWGLKLDEVIEILKKLNINHVQVNGKSIEEFWGPLLA